MKGDCWYDAQLTMPVLNLKPENYIENLSVEVYFYNLLITVS